MEGLKPELISLLNYLLPGFVAMWIYHRLIALPRPSPFECVVEALMFTAIVHFSTLVIKSVSFFVGKIYSLGSWGSGGESVIWYMLAIVFGLLAVQIQSRDDLLFKKLRDWGITGQAAYPNDWFSAFKQQARSYVVLHLQDGRRLFGWPAEWPSSSLSGHITISHPRWLPVDANGSTVEISEVSCILIKVDDVRWVEFVPVIDGGDNVERKNSADSAERST